MAHWYEFICLVIAETQNKLQLASLWWCFYCFVPLQSRQQQDPVLPHSGCWPDVDTCRLRNTFYPWAIRLLNNNMCNVEWWVGERQFTVFSMLYIYCFSLCCFLFVLSYCSMVVGILNQFYCNTVHNDNKIYSILVSTKHGLANHEK